MVSKIFAGSDLHGCLSWKNKPVLRSWCYAARWLSYYFITESEAHIKQALEYNTVQYVDKPIGLKELRSCIESAGNEVQAERVAHQIAGNHVWGRWTEYPYQPDGWRGEITRVPIRDVLYFQGGGKGNRYSIAVLDKNGVSKKELLCLANHLVNWNRIMVYQNAFIFLKKEMHY